VPAGWTVTYTATRSVTLAPNRAAIRRNAAP